MKISFFGHKNSFDLELYYDNIKNLLLNLIKTQPVVELYFGGYGNFDSLCLCIARKLKLEYPEIKIYYVTPYLHQSHLDNINKDLYDDIIFPPIENTPFKFAIIKRNYWIIENSDLIVFYLLNSFGGAYNAYNYAKRKKKSIYIVNKKSTI